MDEDKLDKVSKKIDRDSIAIISEKEIEDIFEFKKEFSSWRTTEDWEMEYVKPEEEEEISGSNKIFVCSTSSIHNLLPNRNKKLSAKGHAIKGHNFIYIVPDIEELKAKNPPLWERIKTFVTVV
ncbi:MAG: hypothetical protein ABEJ83_04665 [Candidatus Nanohaloarchaea archaeon]